MIMLEWDLEDIFSFESKKGLNVNKKLESVKIVQKQGKTHLTSTKA